MTDPSLFTRLRNRKLVQWALAYLAAAWALLEVAGYVGDQFAWPSFVGRFLTLGAGFGFLICLVLAWYHGEKGRQRVGGMELLLVALLLAVAAGALSRIQVGEPEDRPAPFAAIPAADGRPSVAVLPFSNLSVDPGDAYLADAIHEEIITQLFKIGGLRSISRTSVLGYRDPARTVEQIARELGVGSVVQGTVQKVRDRVVVTAQLIDPSADEYLWADEFDREITLDHLLEIKSEISRQIAHALKTRLSPREDALLDSRMTESLEAWQAYRTGLYFVHLPHYSEEGVDRAMREFERAVELDPEFALAWMELANTHAREVFFWTDASEERRAKAKAAADRALALDSPLPEVRLAQGLYHLWLDRDTERALKEIDRAQEGMPNNQLVYEARATVFEVQGRFEEAIQEYRKALTLNPRDASILSSLSWDLFITGEAEVAERTAREAMALAPDQLWPNMFTVLIIWIDRGPTQETERILEGMPHTEGWVAWGRFWQRMLADRYDEAIRVLRDPDLGWIRLKMWARPVALLEAQARRAMGDGVGAERLFEEARIQLEREVEMDPDDPRYHSSLGLALAGLGRFDEAIREVERAVALLPVSEDAWYGLPYPWDLSAVHAMAGNAGEAVRLTERLLSLPSFVSPDWIERDFRLDDIHGDPAYRALIERIGAGRFP